MQIIIPAHGLMDIYTNSSLEETQGCYDHADIFAYVIPILSLYITIGLEAWEYCETYWQDIVDVDRRDRVAHEIWTFVEDCFDHLTIYESEGIRALQQYRDIVVSGGDTPFKDIQAGHITFHVTNIMAK